MTKAERYDATVGYIVTTDSVIEQMSHAHQPDLCVVLWTKSRPSDRSFVVADRRLSNVASILAFSGYYVRFRPLLKSHPFY